MREGMHLEMFQVFAALAGTSSFSKAAESMGITQSAVSQQIRTIERTYQVTLIDRGKRKLTLTPEGKVFLEAACEILAISSDLNRKLLQMREVLTGPLRICTVYSIGLHELPPYLKEFRRIHPDVEVLVSYQRSTQVYTAVSDGEVDIGLVAYPVRRKGMDIFPFWRDRLVVICAPTHPLARKSRLRLPELNGEKFIAFDPDLPTRKEIDRRLREGGAKVKHIMEFDHIETLKRSVEIENGISIVPETTVSGEVKSGTLVAVSIDAPAMWRTLGAVVKSHRQDIPVNRHFLDFLRENAFGGLLKPVRKKNPL